MVPVSEVAKVLNRLYNWVWFLAIALVLVIMGAAGTEIASTVGGWVSGFWNWLTGAELTPLSLFLIVLAALAVWYGWKRRAEVRSSSQQGWDKTKKVVKTAITSKDSEPSTEGGA